MFLVGNRRMLRSSRAAFYCGRPSLLGNPYSITPSRTRDEACDLYETWFATAQHTPEIKQVLDGILQMHKELDDVKDIMLLCWCAPERCHCDTIAAHLNARLALTTRQDVLL